jgi:2,4-dienoyl-CoA reductase-like NADH-dependent reductase (Old Yellow Enzyme family)
MATADLTVLWEEVDVGPFRTRNRIVLNPLTTMWASDGIMSTRHLEYYEERARGGVGMLITEQHVADRDRLSTFRGSSSALEPGNLAVLEQLGERVHSYGAKQLVQLYGAGTLDNANIEIGGFSPIWAPSYVPSAANNEGPLVMGHAEIRELRSNFVRAAKNVAGAGLDGVELHGSHSWLLHQFLSPLYNRRADEYGGSVEGRTRLIREIAAEIRASTPHIAIGLQLSVDDYHGEHGITPAYVEEELGYLGGPDLFDYISLSTGNELTEDATIPPMERVAIPAEACGRRARATVASGVKVLVSGGVQTVENAARLVGEGVADLVAFARPLLADAELVRKAQDGRPGEIRPCVATNECFRAGLQNRGVTCLMNPFAGREGRWRRGGPPRRRRRVTVVGGGPAGLQAATAAAEHGHAVTVLERLPATGGHLGLLAVLPNRGRWRDAIRWFDGAARRAGVKIQTDYLVTEQSPELNEADVVVFATGARWQTTGFSAFRPDRDAIPGIHRANVTTINNAIERATTDPQSLGDRVLIIDETGGYLPLGLADLLSAVGTRVDIVTRFPLVGHVVEEARDHTEVFARLAARAVAFRPGNTVEAITDDGVILTEVWSGRRRDLTEIDGIVLSVLREPNREVYDAAAHVSSDLQLVGDALAPRDTREVIAEAQDVGYAL